MITPLYQESIMMNLKLFCLWVDKWVTPKSGEESRLRESGGHTRKQLELLTKAADQGWIMAGRWDDRKVQEFKSSWKSLETKSAKQQNRYYPRNEDEEPMKQWGPRRSQTTVGVFDSDWSFQTTEAKASKSTLQLAARTLSPTSPAGVRVV